MEWIKGYSQEELDGAQEMFGLTFPPDLVALYRERRPAEAYDWTKDYDNIWRMLRWPYEGLWIDVVHNGLWWESWGPKPERRSDQQDVLRRVLAAAPMLIPILSHRFIPQSPSEAGNPVFSVYQSDIIVYGANLEHYFEQEFDGHSRDTKEWPSIKRIPFWTEMVESRQRSPSEEEELLSKIRSAVDGLGDQKIGFVGSDKRSE